MILELLKYAEYGQSECIDIALGKYKLPMSIKEGIKQMKRERKSHDKKGN